MKLSAARCEAAGTIVKNLSRSIRLVPESRPMFDASKDYLRKTPLADIFIFLKGILKSPTSQHDEALILTRLVERYAPPELFVEFGFSGWEFNCAPLIGSWSGLLVDTNPYNIKIGNIIYPKRITSRHQWLDLGNLSTIFDYVDGRALGVLSVDVDGNDYWFLERLLKLKPMIIIAEYNSSFGLRPITVPYDESFDRMKKHASGLYYGASLKALTDLATSHGYDLVAVTGNGVNAFFVKASVLKAGDRPLAAESAFKEKTFPDGASHLQQWEKIKHLQFVDVG